MIITDPVGAGLDGDPDALEDDDVPEDGTEMVIDPQPLPVPAPAVPVTPAFSYAYVASHAAANQQANLPFHGTSAPQNPPVPPQHNPPTSQAGAVGNGAVSPWVGSTATTPNGAGPSAAEANGDVDDDVLPIQHAMIDISSPPDANGNFGTDQDHQMTSPGGA